MPRFQRSGAPAGWAAIVLAAAALAGCAEVHRGAEAVGRLGAAPAAARVVEDDGAAPAVRTVRPRGSRREADAAQPAPAVVATALPSPRQIFDFHPAGAPPDSWREPFVIDVTDGPLAADVRRSAVELRAFKADLKAGNARGGVARVDGAATGTARRRCSETDVATSKPGCGVPRPEGAATAARP